MYIKVTNRRKTPVPVLGKTVPGKSSIVLTISDRRDIAVLNKLRGQNDIFYYEVGADGSSGKYMITKPATNKAKTVTPTKGDEPNKKESE